VQMSVAPPKLRDLGKSCRKNKKLRDINEGREVARRKNKI